MKSFRLTQPLRAKLLGDILEHGFQAETLALARRLAAFSEKVLLDLMPEKDQVRAAALPKGWLPMGNSVQVQLGEGSNTYVDLAFNGSQILFGRYRSSGPVRLGDAVRNDAIPTAVLHALPYHMESGCVRRYGAAHPLALEWAALQDETNDLTTKLQAAASQVVSTLDAFRSTNALVKAWPEMAPFVAPYEPGDRTLPAVPRARLNAMLDLPVDGARALGTSVPA